MAAREMVSPHSRNQAIRPGHINRIRGGPRTPSTQPTAHANAKLHANRRADRLPEGAERKGRSSTSMPDTWWLRSDNWFADSMRQLVSVSIRVIRG